MGQGLSEGLDGRRSPTPEENQSLTRTVAIVEARGPKHLDQQRHGSALAATKSHGGPLAHDGRPTAKAVEELVVGQRIGEARPILVGPATPVEDQRLGGRGIELRHGGGLFPCQMELLQRHCVGQEIASGAVPSGVAVGFRFRRALVNVTRVPPPREVKVPTAEFPHPCAGGMRTGL